MRKPRIPREVLIKLSRLLNMRYKPSEIAEEIGVDVSTIYRAYIPAGCPIERDSKGRIWIIGTAFREWSVQYHTERKENSKPTPLEPGFAWCLKCRGPAKMLNIKPRKQTRYHVMYSGLCSVCGGKVNRAARPGEGIDCEMPNRKSRKP